MTPSPQELLLTSPAGALAKGSFCSMGKETAFLRTLTHTRNFTVCQETLVFYYCFWHYSPHLCGVILIVPQFPKFFKCRWASQSVTISTSANI